MKYINLFILALSGLIVFAPVSLAKSEVVTTESLLREMQDRKSLAQFPSPAYELKQSGSYDRRSVLKDASGWYSNDDWSMFDYIDRSNGREEYVLMDQAGPGAIVRFWMTFSGNNCGLGTLRIYVDDMKKPVISGSAFDVLSGGLVCDAPLSYSASPLSDYNRRGHNLYYPVLYSERCKVTYESANVYVGTEPEKRRNSEHVYYNVDYRKYASNVKVQPFSTAELKKNAALAVEVNKGLARLDEYVKGRKGRTTPFEATVKAGGEYRVELTGSRAITSFATCLDAPDRAQALRSTVIEILFDGQSTVWCPLGDFFGTGYKDIYTRTWMSSVSQGRYRSCWVMPFKTSCEIVFHNYGAEDVILRDGEVETEPWSWNERSMYFGANWEGHSHYFTGDGLGRTKPKDVAFTRLHGKGVYVGDAVALFDTNNGWWGEGDEKIYVDGESFPSCIGTGTEDYFGYAWCKPEVFTDHPYIAQPSGSGNLSIGYTSNSRYRGLDRIPFNERLDFDMEIWHWTESIINYASTSFWYIRPDGACTLERNVDEVKEKVALKRSDIISPALSMSIEGEDMTVERYSGGIVAVQNRNKSNWSGNNQLFWREAVPGDEMTVSFESPASGIFRFLCMLGEARDYGTFEVLLNGEQISAGVDMYAPEVSARMVDMGVRQIKEGHNTMTVRFLSPAEGLGKCLMGIDKLVMTSQDIVTH